MNNSIHRNIANVLCATAMLNANAQEQSRLSLGGYGDIVETRNFYSQHFNRCEQPEKYCDGCCHGYFDFPHVCISLDYDFIKNWSLGSEFEFVHGDTGTCVEGETEDTGEYEPKPDNVPINEGTDESRLSLFFSGEVDASVRNYTGSRFETPNGPVSDNSSIGKIPGFDIAMEYNFSPRWTAVADVEFISGCGIQVNEISISHELTPSFIIKGGMFMLPMGYCNAGYGYADYFTTGDPEGESSLIPCPFTETGISFLGEFESGISYQASITTGISPLSVSPNRWLKNASQGFLQDETSLSSPALSVRLDNKYFKDLRFGLGGYFCSDIARNMPCHTNFKEFIIGKTGNAYTVPVVLWFADAEYRSNYFIARASYLQGHMNNSLSLADYFNTCVKNAVYDDLDYEPGAIGKDVISYMGEIGFNIKNCFYPDKKNWPDLMPFVHYECYDPQMKVADETTSLREECSKVQALSIGMNWKLIDEIVLKFNYTTRRLGHGGMNSMKELNLGVAYDVNIF